MEIHTKQIPNYMKIILIERKEKRKKKKKNKHKKQKQKQQNREMY